MTPIDVDVAVSLSRNVVVSGVLGSKCKSLCPNEKVGPTEDIRFQRDGHLHSGKRHHGLRGVVMPVRFRHVDCLDGLHLAAAGGVLLEAVGVQCDPYFVLPGLEVSNVVPGRVHPGNLFAVYVDVGMSLTRHMRFVDAFRREYETQWDDLHVQP